MNILKEWLLGVCAAAVLAGLIKALAPNGPITKSLQTVIAVFMLAVILLPLSSGLNITSSGISIDYDTSKSTAVASSINVVISANEQTAAQQEVADILSQLNIGEAKINIIMDKSTTASITIKQIDIYVLANDFSKSSKIISAVENTMGIKTNVFESKGAKKQ